MLRTLFLCLLLSSGSWGVRVRVLVPELVRAGSSAVLVCQFDLHGQELYSVKWYRGQYEFFRYLPRHDPPAKAFPLPGIHVHMPGSNAHQVTLFNVPKFISGKFSCEVSAEAPNFRTGCHSANLTVLEVKLRRPHVLLSSSVYQPSVEMAINCSAEPTQPPPDIIFYINNSKVDEKWVRQMSAGLATMSQEALNEALSKEEGRLEPLWVRCEAFIADLYHYSSTSVPIIPHLYPPQMNNESHQIEKTVTLLMAVVFLCVYVIDASYI